MNFRLGMAAILLAALGLGGCRSQGEIVVEQGVGITALRTVCPAVGVPYFTGDITVFDPPEATTADAMDLTASITNVRSRCEEREGEVYTEANFSVRAVRQDAAGPRSVELPVFSAVMRGGNSVVAKRVTMVRVEFADGQDRAVGQGVIGAYVDRAAATLPEDIRNRIVRRRRAGETAAAIDPLTQPEVRAAIARATFELMLGFQLSEQQLAFNALR